MTICKRCVLPESRPDIRLDKDGVCNICGQFERERAGRNRAPLLETDLLKLLSRSRGKGKYDCLVMCSGGKDSTFALYCMKKKYRLNVLAFTFDHGFENEEALANVNNAVAALGVDFVRYRSDFMREMFAEAVRSGSSAVLCHLCSLWYMGLTFDVAARYGIPLIVGGWTKGQSVRLPCDRNSAPAGYAPEYVSMAKATRAFLETFRPAHGRYRDFPATMEEVLARARKRGPCTVVSPHWFLPFDQETYTGVIARELGWKAPALSYPRRSTNCLLNFISVHNSMKHFGYTHYHIEMSKMIREGLITREQALRDLEISFDRELLASIAQKLGCAFE